MADDGKCSTITPVGCYLDLAGASFQLPEGATPVDPDRLAEFNAVIRAISPGTPPIDAALLARMVRELAAQRDEGRGFIERRLAELDGFQRLAADPAWRLPDEHAERIELALEYLARPDDLIPDATLGCGLLDDAIVIELARRALAAELRDYAEFCRFREAEAAVSGVPVAKVEVDRRDWLAWKRMLQDLEAARGIERFGTPDGADGFRVL